MSDRSLQSINVDAAYLYRALSKTDIVSLVMRSAPEHRPRKRVSKYLTRDKTELLKNLIDDDPYWVQELYKIAIENDRDRLQLKRKRIRRHADRVQVAREMQAQRVVPDEKFLDLPSDQDVLRCYAEAYDATSNTKLEHRVCAVCARLQLVVQAKPTRIPVADIPNRHRLAPYIFFPNQTISHGCLLELAGCHGEEPNRIAEICSECLLALKQLKDAPPKHSLANNLWIGDVPWQLECLNFVEHLLIARVYPRVFVIKLFPRDRSKRNLPEDQLQRALRGNVTSFELNSPAISDMIAGRLMPQQTSILASTLSITFIGRGKIRDPTTLKMLRVRRTPVANALQWLQEYNRKYYGDIIIDKSRLEALPVDGVPDAVLAGIRHEVNESMADDEYRGYVPESYFADNADIEAVSSIEDYRGQPDSDDPDVIPLQSLGVVDSDLSKVTSSELMAWGLKNTHKPADDSYNESGYAIRYGAPVNTFGQPPRGQDPLPPGRRNFWEAAFPLLYPYGVGGIESDRPVQLSLSDHARWSLEYNDRRFRYHNSFIFVVFGIQQRRQGLLSAKIQMKRQDFDNVARTLSTITVDDLKRAADEEKRGEKTSNPAINVLKQNITATAKRVMASGAGRTQLRSQIYSASIYFNQPSIWLTINPDDLHDPVAQVFACEDIDMDRFIKTAGPDSAHRSRNIARDPYAAAKFFHFTVMLVLEKLLGITVSKTKIHTQMGILGRVKAYFGTVECQGRGTLHLHMLIWLHNVPPPRQLKEMLRSDEFKEKVLAYLRANIRTFRPTLKNKAEIDQTREHSDVAYSRLPNPSLPADEFAAQLEELETMVVRAKQVHRCEFGKCLRFDKTGRVSCKRGSPWERSATDSVDQNGTYHTKRTYEFINGYCPAIAHVLKCNQDIKLLLHGNETLQIAYYISKYMTKPEGRTHNVSTLLAAGLTRHFSQDPNSKDYLRRQHDLLLSSVNVLNREQEISAPLAALFIMGNPDVYRSHHPENIFWGSFVAYIYRTFPELNAEIPNSSVQCLDQTNVATEESHRTSEFAKNLNHMSDQSDAHVQPPVGDNQNEHVILGFDHSGKIYKRSQVDDYIHRGAVVSEYNILDYFVNTYEGLANGKTQLQIDPQGANSAPDYPTQGEPTTETSVPGRRMHTRIRYEAVHPRSKTHIRVVRPCDHNHMPNIIGPRFPRRSDPTQANIYAACILVFLKPWRRQEDIKAPDQSWSDALDDFLNTANEHVRNIIDNLEHRHEARAAAEDRQQGGFDPEEETQADENAMDTDHQEQVLAANGRRWIGEQDVTQDMYDRAYSEMESEREAMHGVQAVNIALHKGIFGSQQMPVQACNERASARDAEMLKIWDKLMDQAAETTRALLNATSAQANSIHDIGAVEPLPLNPEAPSPAHTDEELLLAHEEPSEPIPHEELFLDQQRAFGIVRWHVAQTLFAIEHHLPRRPPQLRLLIIGEGGTGKSRVIQTISKELERLGVSDWLVKTAYTGYAAAHIEGHTIHNVARIRVGKIEKSISNLAKKQLTRIWQPVEYLIVDEYSMLSKEFFAQFSRHVSFGKLGYSSDKGDFPFGTVNVILCGDGHQIPPVAISKGGALYHPATSKRFITSPEAGLGRTIFESFELVVMLKQQVRVTDPKWQKFLSNFRVGRVEADDIDILDSITLTNPNCKYTDFSLDKWKDCTLITPRNATQMRWNKWSVTEHCRRTGEQMLVVNAQDTCIDQGARRPITIYEKYVSMLNAASSRNPQKGKRNRAGLPDQICIAIGAKVMVTANLNTEIDITNGARGVIVGIKLDANEPPFSPTEPEITLRKLPAYILVRLDRTRLATLPGLEPGVVPIVPTTRSYLMKVPIPQADGQIRLIDRSVRRIQFPITPAYAFTDYKAQGQTLANAVVDIAQPPTGSLGQPNIYVALSRCSGLENIRILRNFDRTILTKPIDIDLAAEDDRLDKLNTSTQQWWNELTD